MMYLAAFHVAGSEVESNRFELAEIAARLGDLSATYGRPTVSRTDTHHTLITTFDFNRQAGVTVLGASAEEIRAAYRRPVAERTCETEGCSATVTGEARFCADCAEDAVAEYEALAVEAVDGVLNDGTYTLVYDNDEYFTFRVRELRSGRLAGRRVVEFLSGPQNELDFEAFGFVNEATINVWRRFERGHLVNRAREIEAMARNDRDGLESAGLRYAERSSRCRNCNRVLTVPASLASGYGPDCAANLGIAYGETEPTSGNGRTARRRNRAAEATSDEFTGKTDDEIRDLIDRAEHSDGQRPHAATRDFLRRAYTELNRRAAAPTVEVTNEISDEDCPRCGDPVSVCGGCAVAA